MRRMHVQQRRAAPLDEVEVCEPSLSACGRLAPRVREPFERRDGRVVVERGDRKRSERVAEGQGKTPGHHGGRLAVRPVAVNAARSVLAGPPS